MNIWYYIFVLVILVVVFVILYKYILNVNIKSLNHVKVILDFGYLCKKIKSSHSVQ